MKYKGKDSDNLMKIVPENVLQQKTEATQEQQGPITYFDTGSEFLLPY